ncbi:Testicular acid phosphatase, partial [Araneus ventricosus]
VLRHGERAPISLYKNDPNKADFWLGGLAKLTRFGKRHHYAIGKFLRSMYKDFLTTDPKEVCANSSSLDRCLRGAAVTVAALYEPEGIWKFEDDLNWQPIPVYYLPKDEDK